MGKIKLRNTDRDIKVLNRSSNMSRHMKNAYIKTRDRAEDSREIDDNTHNNYATETVSDIVKNLSCSTTKKAEQFGRRSTKTAPDTLKKAQSGAVNMARGIKGTMTKVRDSRATSKTAVKTTRQATKATIKASQKAAQAARTTARATKLAVKAVVTSVKATIVVARSTVALIAAAGWIAVLIIVIICVVALVVSSYFSKQ